MQVIKATVTNKHQLGYLNPTLAEIFFVMLSLSKHKKIEALAGLQCQWKAAIILHTQKTSQVSKTYVVGEMDLRGNRVYKPKTVQFISSCMA